MKIYVEGGGDSSKLITECRRGFSKFFEDSGLKGKMPRIVASGGRAQAYRSFKQAIADGENAFLLVDSEEAVNMLHQPDDYPNWRPWDHLKQRQGDGWEKPSNSQDFQCHFMTQVMESWFLADPQALKLFFGSDFLEKKLPKNSSAVELVAKKEVFKALADSTQKCKKKYSKGAHSFKILALISPEKVMAASPWANRLVNTLKKFLIVG